METHHPGQSRPLGSPDVARKFLESWSVPAPRGKGVPEGGPGYWPPEAVHVLISGAVSVTLCGKRAMCLGLSQRSRDERSFWIIGWALRALVPL